MSVCKTEVVPSGSGSLNLARPLTESHHSLRPSQPRQVSRRIWYGRRESNPHGLRRPILRRLCIAFHHSRILVPKASIELARLSAIVLETIVSAIPPFGLSQEGLEPPRRRHGVLSAACLPFHHWLTNLVPPGRIELPTFPLPRERSTTRTTAAKVVLRLSYLQEHHAVCL